MKSLPALLPLLAVLLGSCQDHQRTVWHERPLLSGGTIKVTSFHLVWGVEHEERNSREDAFALEYVTADPSLDPAGRDAEAQEVFELFRPLSETWGFSTASVARFPSLERRGAYDVYRFERGNGGVWSFARSEAKVFATD